MRKELDLDLDRKEVKIDDIINRINSKKECRISVPRTKNKIKQRIEMAHELVRSGRLKNDGRTKVIMEKDKQLLFDYIQAIEIARDYAFDTETTGLNVFQDIIVGFSLYTDTLPYAIYVPINHTDIENERIPGQISMELAGKVFSRLFDREDLRLFTHNGKYDGKISQTNFGVKIKKFFFDTLIGGKLLNENEKTYELKPLHAKYILGDSSKADTFSDLFGRDVPFNYVPIEVAGIYGALDTIKTLELGRFQQKFIESDRKDMKAIAHVMYDLEMPLIPILIEMELRGIEIDKEYAKELEVIFTKELEEVEAQLDAFVSKYEDKILQHSTLQRLAVIKYYDYVQELTKAGKPKKRLTKVEKGERVKINYNSPPQLQPFVYDILEMPCVAWKFADGKKVEDKGTGEEILLELQKRYPKIEFFDLLLKYRGLAKLLNTYIIKMPNAVEPTTNAIHCLFNQYGAVTGRFSSSEPNLQNIPSHEKRIRKIFKARDGNVLVCVDYSQIEPRILACLSNDPTMKQAYVDGKDLYAELASIIFDKPVEVCGDGTEERTHTKGVLLGIMYDRGGDSIAEEFNKPKAWGNRIQATFFDRFPLVKKFVQFCEYQAETLGYVTTIDGRKRRLPDMQGDPSTSKYRRAHRQLVNSIIQGTSADITKRAMRLIGENGRLKELGVYMLVTIHDECICEVPKENVKEATPIIIECMQKAAEAVLDIPVKLDVEIVERWYGENKLSEYFPEGVIF